MTTTATATDTKKVNRLRDLSNSVNDYFNINPSIVEIEQGHNPRDYTLAENRQHLDQLKASIKEKGVLIPLLVRFDGGKVILVDGECRLRACMELIGEGVPIEAVKCMQVKGKNEADRLIIAMSANTGKPLSLWEAGAAFKKLAGWGWSEEKISKELGNSPRYVKDAIEAADAPEEIKAMLSAKAITPALALSELRTKATGEAVESLRKKVVEARANGLATARKTQENRLPSDKAIFNVIEKLVLSTEDDLFDDEFKFIEVDKAQFRKLAAFVGFTDSEKVQAKKKK